MLRKINRDPLTKGIYKTVFLSMKENDPEQFFKYTRMDRPTFEYLLEKVTPLVKKQMVLSQNSRVSGLSRTTTGIWDM